MTKKQKQSKKSTKSSKRTNRPAPPDDETDMATRSAVTEAPQPTPAIPEAEVAVESQQPVAASVPATPATSANPATGSEAAKASIKEGLATPPDRGTAYEATIDSCLREGRVST
jgi:hypothetical protein